MTTTPTRVETAMPIDLADPENRLALLPYRAVAIGQDEGWYEILGREPMPYPGRYLLGLPGHERVLMVPELRAYVRGLAAAWGQPGLIPHDVDDPPELITVEEAARRSYLHPGREGATVEGTIRRLYRDAGARDGFYELIFLPRRRRALFGADVAAQRLDASADDRERWEEIRARFGLAWRIEMPEPAGDPDRLAVPLGEPETIRRMRALMAADRAGWLRYRTPEDRPNELVFLVDDIAGYPAEVPADDVLPWLLGVADFHGPDGVAVVGYRPGLEAA